jgi:hypothetical protein
MKGVVEPASDAVADALGDTAERIRDHDNLMANYLVKYFNLLAKQITAMDPRLAPKAQCAYVVGCSRLKGVYVATDVILARLFERLNLGYSVERIHRFRKRHSGQDLYESIVYASKA